MGAEVRRLSNWINGEWVESTSADRLDADNPATGEVEPKVGFYKLVRAQGIPLLVGSGYNP